MEKKSVKLSNNETYYYLEDGISHKETMLLVHGNMSSSIHYLPVFKDLAKDYHVIAPDLRGFGDSTYTNPIESLEDLADDVKLFMEALNLDKVYLTGWSTGGGIGLKFAAKYPKHILKLILIESASIKGYPIFKKDAQYQPILTEQYKTKEDMAKDPVQVLPALNAMINKDKNFMGQIWKAAIYNVLVPGDIELFLDETLKQRNLIDIDWALMTFNMSDESNGLVKGDASYKKIKCPILSIYGLKDIVIPRYMFDETVKAFSNIETHIFEEGSHSPITDFPNDLVQVIKTFVKQ